MQTGGGTPQSNTLRVGRIAKIYPEKHVVDVVFMDDGGFASGVPLSTQWGSQEHGFHYMPKVDIPKDGQWSVELTDKNDSLALIGYFSGQPFVVGTYFPANKDASMNHLPENTLLLKHISGAFILINPDGVITLRSSGGAVINLRADGVVELNP